MSDNLTKPEIRQLLLAHRKSLDSKEVQAASKAVVKPILNKLSLLNPSTIHIYKSIKTQNEIDTKELIYTIKRIYPEMKIVLGEQKPNSPMPNNPFDVIIVPVVGFDNKLNRLGMGSGWYDKWLATQTYSYKIGLAYSWAKVSNISPESHDIKLDLIIAG